MGTAVLPPDLEAWLTGYVRSLLPSAVIPTVPDVAEAKVSNKERDAGALPPVKIVIRDDGGPRTSLVTFQRSVGVSVLAGTRINDSPARDLARWLFAVLTDDSLPLLGGSGCPITDVSSANGPYPVDENQDRTRMYFTVEYAVAGTPVG